MKYFLGITFLLLASFIKCIVDSEINKQFFYRRSMCDNCNTELQFFDLIPLFSYLFRSGKCAYCKVKIPTSVFLYEFFALLVAICYLFFCDKVYFLNYFDYLIVLILIFIAIEDILTFEINEKLQFILLFVTIIRLVPNFLIKNLLFSFFLILIYHVIYYFLQNGLGYGDIKLLSILSLNIDLLDGVYLFSYTFIYAGFFAIYLLVAKKVNRKSKLALAPFICLAYVTLLINRELLLW